MCGIAGIVSVNPNDVTINRIKAMTDSIEHRGPDGEGQWISENGRVGLGHRRLSIIDLSEHANQPMFYLDRYSIVFNGEIYNYIELRETLLLQGYRFRTASDTEVLMALYDRDKEKCLSLLDGMFSFAIYDKKEETLFCARDRFGEKPFHYFYEPGKSFVFGSEMKELWAAGIPKVVNQSLLYNYILNGYLQKTSDLTETFYSNIQRLEHAHYLIMDVRTLSLKTVKYWSVQDKTYADISFDKATEKFKELFLTSVQRRLRSDVPVGSSLSGGLDSSAVVCAIDELNTHKQIHQKTFSARFPGFKKDESYYQQLVIDKTEADAYFTTPDASVMLKELDKVCWHQEEPFGSASILAQYEVFKLAKQQNVTVLLDGQGADEILAGYHYYYQFFFLELEKNKSAYQSQWDEYIKLHSNNAMNGVFKKDLKYKVRSAFPFAFNMLKKSRDFIKDNRGDFAQDFYAEVKHGKFEPVANYKTLNNVLARDTSGGPLQELLRYADRNSMAHSREVRLPFLSHELVEFLYTLPATYKMNSGWSKYIMRKSFEGMLPNEITWRVDKIGYEPPQKQWMQTLEVKEIIHERRKQLVGLGILDKAILSRDIDPAGAHGKDGDNSWRLWMAAKLYDNN